MIVTRCLSLIQPWATLIAIGAKRIETRSWQTPYRGWLAIHASKAFPRDCQEFALEQPCADALARSGVVKLRELPLGKVIAVAFLHNCFSTNNWTPPIDSDEYAFGGYGPDRVGWQLENIRRLREPFDAKGSLGLWTLPRPITVADLEPATGGFVKAEPPLVGERTLL